MAGTVSFQVNVLTKGLEQLPELAARIKNFSVAFHSIIDEWAQSNRDKFGLGEGMEASGVYQDSELYWQQLTPPYMKHKRSMGQKDSLMVATGQLKESMTDPFGFSRSVDEAHAVFGMPLGSSEQDKILFNWSTRQVLFLNAKDRLAIKREVTNYLNIGENYKEILFARGLERSQLRSMKTEEEFWEPVS